MSTDFEIKDGVLIKYHGKNSEAFIPRDVIEIGSLAFSDCVSLTTVFIPYGVRKIGNSAFLYCIQLESVFIPDSVTEIDDLAFHKCFALKSVMLPNHLSRIGDHVFRSCNHLKGNLFEGGYYLGSDQQPYLYFYRPGLGDITAFDIHIDTKFIGSHAFEHYTDIVSVTIPKSVTTIGSCAFRCTKLTSITVPNNVIEIGDNAFRNCTCLKSVSIPDSVRKIGDNAFLECSNLDGYRYNHCIYLGNDKHPYLYLLKTASKDLKHYVIHQDTNFVASYAFQDCEFLESVLFSKSITKIDTGTFLNCTELKKVEIPKGIIEIGAEAFRGCTQLNTAIIPDNVTQIRNGAFEECPDVTVICVENSTAHAYAKKNYLYYLFDYQNDFLKKNERNIAAPFKAEDEEPYIFISYSHKDRNRVFAEIKKLYEAGWKIWFDEGLAIGESYDQTLEAHVLNCSVFLFFLTKNSAVSHYIDANEIPWATKKYHKPFIKCVLDEDATKNIDYADQIEVRVDRIENTLYSIEGLTKGEERKADGISVVVDLTARKCAEKKGYTYCLYDTKSSLRAKNILHTAKNKGCKIYDAIISDQNSEKLKNAVCLTVFLDKNFLENNALRQTLEQEFQFQKDIAVWLLEEVVLPEELKKLGEIHWLNCLNHNQDNLNVEYAEYLSDLGCRDESVIPDFEYEIINDGVVLTKYTGMDQDVSLLPKYGEEPLIILGDRLFFNQKILKSVVIPEGVLKICTEAFLNCSNLTSVIIPGSVMKIAWNAFEGCNQLTVKCPPKSYVDQYCQMHNIPVEYIFSKACVKSLVENES